MQVFQDAAAKALRILPWPDATQIVYKCFLGRWDLTVNTISNALSVNVMQTSTTWLVIVARVDRSTDLSAYFGWGNGGPKIVVLLINIANNMN